MENKHQYNNTTQYESAFLDFLKGGWVPLEVDTDDWGCLLPECAEIHIKNFLESHSIMRQICTTIEMDVDSYHINDMVIFVNSYGANPRIVNSHRDSLKCGTLLTWLADTLAHMYHGTEQGVFLHGDGIGKPLGLLGTPMGQDNKMSAELTPQSISDLYFMLPREYVAGASFLMHPDTASSTKNFRHPYTDNHMWGIDNDGQRMLHGLPSFTSEEMPKDTIILADFKKTYHIVDKIGLKVLVSSVEPFTQYYVTKSTGGSLVDSKAIRILEIKGTTND